MLNRTNKAIAIFRFSLRFWKKIKMGDIISINIAKHKHLMKAMEK